MKKKSKREKAEKRVIKAAMRWFYAHPGDLDRWECERGIPLVKACSSLHKLPKR